MAPPQKNETTPLIGGAAARASPPSVTADSLNKARRLLYISHTFAQLSECIWQFALILFLGAVTNFESLAILSSYGLVAGLTVCLFGSTAGRFVDRADRLVVAQWFIWTENLCVLVATLCCFFLLRLHEGDGTTVTSSWEQDNDSSSWLDQHLHGIPLDTWSVVLLIGIHIFGPAAKILDKGFIVAMERDWVVVMSHAAGTITQPLLSQKEWLSQTNVAMKQIDLSSRVAAPAVAGFVIAAFDTSDNNDNGDSATRRHGTDLTGAVILVGAVNVAALIVEYICTARIYNLVPPLTVKQARPANTNGHGKATPDEEVGGENGNGSSKEFKRTTDLGCAFFQLPQGLRIYLAQPISWSGLGLAMLYLNSLSFGALMTAYLVWKGMRLETVGIWRGISCIVGLAGTFAYHASVKRTTLVKTGMWSICYQFTCLSMCFASLFVSDYNTSVAMLVGGACASRIGLWVFDISVTQLMQEFIPDGIRGVVGGTQQSLNAFFSLLSFALGLIFPDPRKFHIYVAAGYTAVGVAAIMYALGVFLRRNEFLTSGEKESRRTI